MGEINDCTNSIKTQLILLTNLKNFWLKFSEFSNYENFADICIFFRFWWGLIMYNSHSLLIPLYNLVGFGAYPYPIYGCAERWLKSVGFVVLYFPGVKYFDDVGLQQGGHVSSLKWDMSQSSNMIIARETMHKSQQYQILRH